MAESKDEEVVTMKGIGADVDEDLMAMDPESEEYKKEYKKRYMATKPPRCLTDEQKEQLKEFRKMIDEDEELKAIKIPDFNLQEGTLHRFLKARKFKVPKAFAMYKKAMLWRAKEGVDGLEKVPKHVARLIKVIAPFHYDCHFGHDKAGCPIYYWRMGRVHAAELVKRVSLEQYKTFHLYLMEKGGALTRDAATANGHDGQDTPIVIDSAGLGLHVRHYLNYFKVCMQIDEAYYPETMGTVFIINAPRIFPFIYGIVKPWLDPVTASKVNVLGKDYKEVLLRHIDKDQLLEEYGGTAKAPPEYEAPELTPEYLEELTKDNEPDDLEEVLVPNRGKHVKEFDVDDVKSTGTADRPGAAVFEYYFKTVGHDVAFQVTHVDATTGETTFLVKKARLSSNKHAVWGEVVVRDPGTVTFTWDNSYSMFTRKTLFFSVTRTDTDLVPTHVASPSALEHQEAMLHDADDQ